MWNKTLKIRAEISGIKNTKTLEKIKERKALFFEKITKIDKPLARQTKKEDREKTNKIRNKPKEIITDPADIKKKNNKGILQTHKNFTDKIP